MNNVIAEEFIKECNARIESSSNRLIHCIEQLNENNIWWKPNTKMNSIGMLIIHICGSFRQWAITSINNEEDIRHRPDEFSNETQFTKSELIEKIITLKTDFCKAINKIDVSQLTEKRVVQGFDTTIIRAVFRALTHLEGHIGQIVLLTRIQSGDNYK